MSKSKSKGSQGEREICDYMKELLNLKTKPKRNLDQVRDGGSDVLIEPFCIEVKRCESLSQRDWWNQVNKACKKVGPHWVPIVAYRQNRKKWNFLIPFHLLYHSGAQYGFIHLEEREFRIWAVRVFKSFLISTGQDYE